MLPAKPGTTGPCLAGFDPGDRGENEKVTEERDPGSVALMRSVNAAAGCAQLQACPGDMSPSGKCHSIFAMNMKAKSLPP